MKHADDEVLVTVQCLAYNHEKYIRKALDGFVMQKTSFKFEVIVHDDASTDHTADIIREYAEKYDFIQPIFQTENQYSQKVSILKNFVLPAARGKYLAFCEGDDYWTDENKLQILTDYMEQHPSCSMACHAYNRVSAKDETVISTIRTLDKDGVIPPEKAIRYEAPPQLAAQIFRTEQIKERPAIFSDRGVGDYTMLLYAVTKGELYYIDRVMSNKRDNIAGSWSERVYNNPEKKLEHWNMMKAFLADFNELTRGEYREAIQQRIDVIDFDCCWIKRDYKAARKSASYPLNTWKRKLAVCIGCICPPAADWIIRRYGR